MAQGYDHDSSNPAKRGGSSRGSGIGRMGGEAVSQLSDAAQEASKQARDAASSLAAQASDQVRMLADRQVSAGADLVGDVAESVRSAAGSLDDSVPQLAHLARGAADRIEDLSDAIRDQSAAEVFQATADFARRRPAVLFGATAICGFLLVRLLTAAPLRRDEDWDDADDWEDWVDEEDEPTIAGSTSVGGNTMTGAGDTRRGGRQPYGA